MQVAVTLHNPETNTIRVLRRFRTVRAAERWVANLKTAKAKRQRELGWYGIDAPEELVNP